jgi:hypothetical protein
VAWKHCPMDCAPMAEAEASRRPTTSQEVMGWLTLERAAYSGAVVLALMFRLLLLGAETLGPAEAAQALPAVAAAAGREFELNGVSPLLFGLQRLPFVLFGASDAWARAWPALLGGLAPLLFLGLSRPLGRGGALVAAYLWAVSPMAVFTSRLGLGNGLVPIFALAIVSGVAWSLRADSAHSQRLGLTVTAGAIGLLLASGSGAYTVLMMALPAALIWRRSLPILASALKACWKQAAGVFLLCLVLGSTFFFMAPSGLAAAADLLGRWVRALRPEGGEYGGWEIGLRLVLSEPVLLVFGLAGVVMAFKRKDRFGIFASIFAGLALLVSLVGSGRHPSDLGLVVLALILLAGPVIARVLLSAWPCRREIDAWLLVSVSTMLLLSAALCLPGILNPGNTASWRQLYTAVGIVTAVLAGLVWLVYGVWWNWRTVALAAPVVPLFFGLAWGLGQVMAINYDRGAWRQPGVLHEAPAPAWGDLQQGVLDLASLHGTGKGEAAIDLVLSPLERESLDPALRWALRAYPNVRVIPSLSPAVAPVVVTLPGEQPRLSSRYSGTEIVVLQRWDPSALTDFYSRVRWVLYREAKQPGEARSIVLWMRRPELPAGSAGEGTELGGTEPQSGFIE